MSMQIRIEGNTLGEIADGLRAHLTIFEKANETAPKSRNTSRTAQAEERVEEETETTSDDGGWTDDEENESEKKQPQFSRGDLLNALRAHPDSKKVAKMLKTKFDVKNINELATSQYGEVIAAVKKLK